MAAKTSLRNFQSEIDQIRHKELARQREQAAAAAERAKDAKDVKKSASRATAQPASPTVGKASGADPHPQIKDLAEPSDVDEEIQVRNTSSIAWLHASWSPHLPQSFLLSTVPEDHDKARNHIASLLTRHRGEYLLRIGAHPPHSRLFSKAPGSLEDSEGWRGSERTAEELDNLEHAVTDIVADIGGVVCALGPSMFTVHPHSSRIDYGSVRHKNKTSPCNTAITITSRKRVCHSGGALCCGR